MPVSVKVKGCRVGVYCRSLAEFLQQKHNLSFHLLVFLFYVTHTQTEWMCETKTERERERQQTVCIAIIKVIKLRGDAGWLLFGSRCSLGLTVCFCCCSKSGSRITSQSSYFTTFYLFFFFYSLTLRFYISVTWGSNYLQNNLLFSVVVVFTITKNVSLFNCAPGYTFCCDHRWCFHFITM